MGLFSKQDLQELNDYSDGLCISIYLPTETAGAETQQNPIRLKNRLQEAAEQLDQRGLSKEQIDDLLKPAQNMVSDMSFWRQQEAGLALFLTEEGLFTQYQLPIQVEPQTIVGQQFYIKPLLPLINNDGRFIVLALSQKTIRLLTGTRFSVDEIDLEGMPKGLAEVLYYDQPAEYLQHHTGARADTGQGGIHHGQEAEGPGNKDVIRRYFQRIDEQLSDYLSDEDAPLVLAGVDYLLPLYREASDYENLVEEGITGNPDQLSAKELHAEAWPLVAPIFDSARQAEIERYEALAGRKEKTADSVESVVPAAFHGRIETLLIPIEAQLWGRYDPETHQVVSTGQNGEEARELLDVAARQTLEHGGTVYTVEAEEMPQRQLVAAILRY